MDYLVKVTPRAEGDLTSLYLQINATDSERARHWYFALTDAILGLREMPNRNSTTRENKRLRHILYGKKPNVYRVIYRVTEKRRLVEVLHIRHGARRRFKQSDLR